MLVEGINVVRELLESNSRVEKIIAEKSNNPEIVKILDKANAVRVPIEIVEKQDLERIAKGKTQGVVAFVPNFRYVELEDILLVSKSKNKPAFIVVLDGVVDPHNVGAIIRTCECAGVDGVIIPENRACDINSTVYKTSAGAITHVKVAQVTNLTRTIEKLKENGIWCYALEAGEKTIYDADFKYPTALIVGSEGKGVSRLVKETCDEVVSLDMFGEVNSLNASNAAAIAVYEVVRQRRN
ncbi:MAG: 23S rRNA (guanosine(2251)-2'-O)-methyltransferase RlmB [Clostridia bacterium]|nr:23S rRNA (guanosine(2251)-2'-O)-methyltransferase RlmB [Clostridia bacterium]